MPGFFTDYMNNTVLNMVIEPSGGGYSRIAVVNNAASFPAASAGTKSNGLALAFPPPTAAWGTIQSLFVADAATGGNVLAMADVATPKTINNGSTPATVAVGALFLSHT
jgi:hypothetical protein